MFVTGEARWILRSVLFGGAFSLAAISPAAHAQESDLVWQFNQNNAGTASTAELNLHVPETENMRVFATCGAGGPEDAAYFTIAANAGDQQNGAPTSIRFSGNGKEYQIAGVVERPQSGEGLFGVKLTVPNDHEIWQAFDTNPSLDYQVPGYASDRLNLVGGQSAIKNFVEACRFLASGNKGVQSGDEGSSASGLTEKEAFQLAKDLDTADAWNAFLKIYPQGFFADLAKGYLAKNGGGDSAAGPQDPVQPPQAAKLTYSNPGPATTPWFNSDYEQDEGNASSFAAKVKANGSEFVLWCGDNKRLMAIFRETGQGQHPDFDRRVMQGIEADPNFTFQFSGGESYRHRVQVYEINGEVGIDRDFSGSDPMVAALLSDNSFDIRGGPFGATYQLKNSRRAICSVTQKCGVKVAGCAPTRNSSSTPKPIVKKGYCSSRSTFVAGRGCILNKYLKPRTKPVRQTGNRDTRCRARSVWIDGRGCVRRRSLNGSSGANGSNANCPRDQRRFRGRCMYPAEIANICGPGYNLHRGKCRPNQQVRMLRFHNGGTISLDGCRRRGMTEEGNFCVEDD